MTVNTGITTKDTDAGKGMEAAGARGRLRQVSQERKARCGSFSTRVASDLRKVTIDCDECVMTGTHACDDCVVSYIVNRDVADCLVMDLDEVRAMRLLAEGGLAPRLRYVSGTS
ncbi:MAG: hypothetical protein ACYDEY_15430 [Acidimicrobiales bacterium]